MKKSVLYIACVLVATVSIAIFGGRWLYENRTTYDVETELVLEGNVRKTRSVYLEEFYPTYSTSYPLKITGEVNMQVRISFEEKGACALAPYVDVEILHEGVSRGKGKLSEYLSGQTVAFYAAFETQASQTLEIVYSMGEEVGDEAQDTVAKFDVVVESEEA